MPALFTEIIGLKLKL